jgi:imidazolonepropionase-like amidohydrolase
MDSFVLFKNANLIDCVGLKAKPNSSVLIKNNRIESINPPEKSIPKEVSIIDLKGQTLMPGLIDNHVHVAVTTEYLAIIQGKKNFGNAMKQAGEIQEALSKTLDGGFTTIRDVGGATADIRECINNKILKGPRILISGAMLSQTGGHADTRVSLNDKYGQAWSGLADNSIICDGKTEIIKAVREQLRKHVDWVKVIAGGGVLSPTDKLDTAQFSIEELKTIVETAFLEGTPVTAHCHSILSMKNAILAGIKCIEHATMMTDEILELAIKNNCVIIPTLSPAYDFDLATLTKEVREKAEYLIPKQEEYLTKVFKHRNELKIGSGTDTFGEVLAGKNARELKWKVKYGYTPIDAIISATKINAEILGLDKNIGTIEPGKIADLIVVDKNPLDNIEILQEPNNIKLVMLDGCIKKNALFVPQR